MASKIAQDSPTCLKIAHNMPPRGSKTTLRRLQVAKEPPKEAPEKPKSFKHRRKSMFLAFSPFRFRGASEASRWLQDDPRDPQEGPKRVPRGAQERPRAPQERPKRAPRGPFEGPDGGTEKGSTSFLIDGLQDGPKRAPKAPKKAPREPQERPQRAPRQPQEGPRSFQNVPKRALRWPQEAYKTLPERTIAKVLILTPVVVVFALCS